MSFDIRMRFIEDWVGNNNWSGSGAESTWIDDDKWRDIWAFPLTVSQRITLEDGIIRFSCAMKEWNDDSSSDEGMLQIM